jgi:hypothetical protein
MAARLAAGESVAGWEEVVMMAALKGKKQYAEWLAGDGRG